MIRSIRGTVRSLEPGGVVVDVAGWGVFVHLAAVEPLPIGSEVTLSTHLVLRQDGPELYGFLDSADRAFFEQLLVVPGLGPKTALSLLRRASREQLERAIAARDLAYLTRVVGLGKKSAEKLVVELAEKITPQEGVREGDDADVFDMLVALGYTDREARQALGAVPEEVVGREARLKAALSATLR
ncbi:MAG TPA: Holliday junction branch migration protein RuvA [Candidatus Paceibacterota bacterium]|nr:Holliday junction branch migration protein RuvA [Candidatus Paceibacterota bacterium]